MSSCTPPIRVVDTDLVEYFGQVWIKDHTNDNKIVFTTIDGHEVIASKAVRLVFPTQRTCRFGVGLNSRVNVLRLHQFKVAEGIGGSDEDIVRNVLGQAMSNDIVEQ